MIRYPVMQLIMNSELLLEMNNICKSYPGVQALKDVSIKLSKSHTHILLGENGAGKSTLMRILSGEEQPDSGRIVFEGKDVRFPDPKSAQLAGISMIHQELSPVLDMTVAENLYLGREITKGIVCDYSKTFSEAQKILDEMQVSISPKELMKNLTVAEMQMVEIAKAISFRSKIFIMDEPTSAISDAETDILFKMIEKLKSEGAAIIYITHKMDEIYRIADKISIFRDGTYVGTYLPSEITPAELIEKMVDRKLDEVFPVRNKNIGEEIMSVSDLCRCGEFENISFSLRKGEILGLGGLMGAGRTEIVEAIFGITQLDSGEIHIKGKKVDIRNPMQAINNKIGIITDDRKLKGLSLQLDIAENIVVSVLNRFRKLFKIDYSAVNKCAQSYCDSLKIKCFGLKQQVGTLSGGNQQKVVLSKWLVCDLDILIFDEPTRGIDVGAKSDFYKIISDLADSGKAIIFISSEMPELLAMSDRIIVLHEGIIKGELSGEEATQQAVMKLAAGA